MDGAFLGKILKICNGKQQSVLPNYTTTIIIMTMTSLCFVTIVGWRALSGCTFTGQDEKVIKHVYFTHQEEQSGTWMRYPINR